MGKGVFWSGKYFVIPQAASTVDSSALNRSPLGGANRLALLVDCVGLIAPKTAKQITTPSLGLQLIHPSSEEARQAVRLAFDPSPGSEVPGASQVYIVPVNSALQSSLTFDNKLVLTSYLYGLISNQIKAKVESGSTAGKKVSIQFQDQAAEVFDNLERRSFSIQYTGVGSAATLTVDLTAKTLTTAVTGAAGDNLNLSLTTYDSIQALVDAIVATGKYAVSVLTDRPKEEKSIHLDAVSAQNILASAYTAKSDLQGIIEYINARSAYVGASRVSGATVVPANQDWTYLSGGSNGTVTTTDWQAAFDLLKTLDVDLIVPLTSDASVHAMADSHADYMSSMEGKSERRVFVGGALQTWTSESNRTTAVASLKAAAKALNSDRTMHVGLGCSLYNYDGDGKAKTYPGYVTACAYAGIAAGGSPVLPLTRKYLRVNGLEVELRKAEIQELIEAGVAVPIADMVRGAGFVISRQVTTWNQSDDLYRMEFSVGRGADFISREVRKRHEDLIGQPGTEALDTTIVNLTNSVLEQARRDELIRSYDPTKTQLRAEGTIRYIDYFCQPILPINWIFSTYHLEPVSFTIQVQE